MSRQHSRLVAVIVAVIGLALGSETANAQTNYLTDLGAVAPALGINNSGQVVLQNYIYSNGTLTAFPANFTGSAINSSGEVAGSDSTTSLGAAYTNGSVTDIPGAIGQAFGINDNGAIVGTNDLAEVTNDNPNAWLYSNGVISGLPTLNWMNIYCIGVTAQAINDSGQITGGARSPTAQFCIEPLGPTDAYLDVGGSPLTDLGPGIGYAINASGQVTGISYTSIQKNSPQGANAKKPAA
jgi:probable HAF family extracellular repeat protein